MKLIKDEEFRDIPNYEGFYQVSNFGRVKTLANNKARKEKMLRPYINGGGYLVVTLYKDGESKRFPIHQLVAIAFLNHTPNGRTRVVDHKDNNQANNHLDNLQIITFRENLSKDKKGGSSIYTGVCLNKALNKWISNIYINGKRYNLGYYEDEKMASDTYQIALKLHLEGIDGETIKGIIKNGLSYLKIAS